VCNISDDTLSGCQQNSQLGVCFWTAGQRIDPSRRSTFVWRETSTGSHPEKVSLISYTNWLAGEPNYSFRSDENEACMNLYSASSYIYKWSDTPCSFLMCSVCEIDM